MTLKATGARIGEPDLERFGHYGDRAQDGKDGQLLDRQIAQMEEDGLANKVTLLELASSSFWVLSSAAPPVSQEISSSKAS